jgi:NAD(P)-dependent dehydrogenase (short-subunit alcohol dehydrogenase family)
MLKAPDFRVDGKVALVTGSGRGIGLGMARALAAEGCAVALQDIEPAVAQKEADRIESEGGRAIALAGDVTDTSWPKRWVDETVRQLGGIHILINNAAIQIEKPWTELSVEEIELQYRANLTTPILLCQQVGPIFRRQKWGRIINVGSIQQKNGNPTMLAYSSSKLALENITKGLARDLAKDGVTANLVAPGYFNTFRNRDHFTSKAALEEKGKWIPLGHVGEPEEVGGVTVMLCSEAGAYVTGQTIFVDGGMSVR